MGFNACFQAFKRDLAFPLAATMFCARDWLARKAFEKSEAGVVWAAIPNSYFSQSTPKRNT